MPITKGQIYRSLHPLDEGRRIRVVSDPITMFGRYGGYGKVDVVTLTDDGREIRPRAIEARQLHQTAVTRTGQPRRTGYVLESA